MLHGYDVSNVNGDIVIPDDAQFIIAKVSQDLSFVDHLYLGFRDVARQREIGFGGYHYGDPTEQPDADASCDRYMDLLGDQREGEIGALDVELNTGFGGFRANSPINRPWVVRWGVRFVLRKGYKPKLYISKVGLEDFDLDHTEIPELYDLWYAWWPFDPAHLVPPPAPSPFVEYKLWQFNADVIDKDKYLGTMDEFKLGGMKAPQPVPDAQEYEAKYWTPIQNLLNDMVAKSSYPHADAAFHATASNAITQHKISLGVEKPV